MEDNVRGDEKGRSRALVDGFSARRGCRQSVGGRQILSSGRSSGGGFTGGANTGNTQYFSAWRGGSRTVCSTES